MADAENSLPAISEDTKGMLEDHVKKGKARKFILICKGASIKTLIVFKKGPFGPKVTQAKKDGFRGEAFTGIITGKGVNIQLQLPGSSEVSSAMKTDGNVYTGEPCKTAKLRKFLVEEAELKFKPEFQLVTQLSDMASVSETDEDEAPPAPPPESSTAGTATPPEPPPPPTADDGQQKAKLIAALKNLTPLIQQAVGNHPARKDEILAPVASIKQHLQGDSLAEAKKEILEYAPFVKTLATGAPPPPPPPGETDNKQSEWEWRLKELTPKLKQVLTEKKGNPNEIAGLFKQAQARKPSSTSEAVDLLKQCAALVEAALKAPDEETASPADPAAGGVDQYKQTWLEVSAEFTTQRAQVAAGLPDQLGEFEQIVSQANQLASGEEYFQAVQVAMKLAELDTQARKAATAADVKDSIPEHIVEDRKKFLLSRWQDAVRASYVEIEKIASPIAKQVPDEDPQELVSGITEALDEFVDELNDAIMGAQTASSENMQPLDRALKAIRDYRAKIQSDPLIAQLDQAKSSLGVEVKVSDQLLTALGDVEARLAG